MSIRQNPHPSGALHLPDFANLGVWLRVLLGVHVLVGLGALAANQHGSALPSELVRLAALVEPALIVTLLWLRLLRRLLLRLPGLAAAALVLCIALAGMGGSLWLSSLLEGSGRMMGWRVLCWTALCVLCLLWYFDRLTHQHLPALAEARLAALTARIRPHFLFNSLNAVLGVIRSDPRRAEAALEALADLFRVLMRENRTLVPLSEEIALARQYLSLERLRLGDRLRVCWQIEDMPPDAMLPPLMLQPLLENAVYHGIEPLGFAGEITITLLRQGDQLHITLSNPCPQNSATAVHSGNQMALTNIRERLSLFFDLDARLDARADPHGGRYDVHVVLPYRRPPL